MSRQKMSCPKSCVKKMPGQCQDTMPRRKLRVKMMSRQKIGSARELQNTDTGFVVLSQRSGSGISADY
jgi:hypothetical protein